MMTALWRVLANSTPHWAVGPPAEGPRRFLDESFSLDSLLEAADSTSLLQSLPITEAQVPPTVSVLPPIEGQEVWASGVTFDRSLAGRAEESQDEDVYDRVFSASRPELFFKSTPERVRGTHQTISIRSDSDWNVPKPEMTLVVNATGQLVAVTLGNDVSSRSIEAENPLYLPQAKIFTGSCAIGPCLVPVMDPADLRDLVVSLAIVRNETVIFRDSVAFADMRRKPSELIDWLFRCLEFPRGVVLMTGTWIVPRYEFTSKVNDKVIVDVPELGSLVNSVKVWKTKARAVTEGALR